MKVKFKKAMLSVVLIAVILVGIYAVMGMVLHAPKAEAAEHEYVYRLDFSDADALGANSGDARYSAAEVHGTAFTRVGGPKTGTYGLQFPASAPTPYTHYLNLPNNIFENAKSATVAGWFRVPSNIGSWVPELGIFSVDNNKSLRADPYAPNSRNGYLFAYGNNVVVDGSVGKTFVTPMYDRWQHMAYVMDGGVLTIYQNGAKVLTIEDGNMSPDKLYSDNSVFYIGQNGYEHDHPDYTGAVSDFRVYRKALNAQDIASEFDLTYNDFLTAEYTFDDGENPYKENVNGYDGISLRPHDWTGPTTDPVIVKDGAESVMRLDGNSAFVIARKHDDNLKNERMLYGHSEMTVSLDVKLNGDLATNTGWERIWDIIIDKNSSESGYITAMAHAAPGSGTELIYGNTNGQQKWVFGHSATTYILEDGKWVNLTYVFSSEYIAVYANGELIVRTTDVIRPLSDILFDFIYRSSYFTIGSPVHEGDRRLAADYDNIRIWACALNVQNVMEVVSGNPLVADSVAKFTLDGEEMWAPAGKQYTLPVLEKYGYEFGGWFDNADHTGESVTEITPVSGAAYFSKWEKATYTITYSLPENAVNPNTVTEYHSDTDDIVFADATMPGYTFDGWFVGDNKIEGIATGQNVGGNITLVAKFTIIEYTVAYNADGGAHTNPEKYTVETAAALSDAEKTGYDFLGWFDASTGGNEITTLVGQTSDLTLYARFAEKTFELTLDLDQTNGSFTVKAGNRTITESGSIGWSERVVTVTANVSGDYSTYLTFNGSMLSAGADGVYTVTVEADGTLKGYFAEKGYILDVSFDGAFGGVQIGGNPCAAGKITVALSFDGSYRVSAAAGYYISSVTLGGDTVTPDYGTAVYEAKLALTADSTLDIVFAALNTYTLAFDGNGGSGTIAPVDLLWSDEYELPSNNYEKLGYHFGGWGLTADGEAEYAAGDKVSSLTQSAETVTLYAVWVANKYTVRFELAGGSGDFDDVTLDFGQEYTLVGSVAKQGYEFIGWGVTADGLETYKNSDKLKNLSVIDGAVVTLYAKYIRKLYTVTIVTESGTITLRAAYREGIRLSDYVDDEKSPSGWKVGDSVLAKDGVVFVHGDMTAVARYSPDMDISSNAAGNTTDGGAANNGIGTTAVAIAVAAVISAIAIIAAVCYCRRKRAR